MQMVLKGEPWHFNQHVLTLKEGNGEEERSTIDIYTTPFWVRACDLPLKYRKEAMVVLIGNRMGRYLGMETEEENQTNKFLRFKAILDLRRQLKHCLNIKLKREKRAWIYLKYEKLPNLCYTYGCFGHTLKACSEYECEDEEEGEEQQFGEWLRALTIKKKARVVLDPTPRKNGKPAPASNIYRNHGNKIESNGQHNEGDDIASIFNGCLSN